MVIKSSLWQDTPFVGISVWEYLLLNLFCFTHIKLKNAYNPKPVMTTPEILLTQRRLSGLNFFRNSPKKVVKKRNHSDDPVKTPRTNIPADQ